MLDRDFSSRRVHHASGDGEGSRGSDARAGKVHGGKVVEVLEDGLDGTVGQEEADCAAEVLG